MHKKRWVAAATVAFAGWAAPAASAEIIYGVTDADAIVTFDSATPGATPISGNAISGLGAGETIRAIDVRPATLQLYGLSSTGQIYRIDTVSGAATAVGDPLTLMGNDFDIDFNPNVDRLRVVTDAEQNLRVTIDNQADTVTSVTDTALTPAGNVTGSAYTRNAPLPDSTTTLFDIDTAGTDRLVRQDPPNGGTLVDVGPLGVDLIGDVGFDISTRSSAGGTVGTDTAFVVGRLADTTDRLYTVNLTSGALTSLGELSGNGIRDIAVSAPIPQIAVLYTSTPLLLGDPTQQIVTVRADTPEAAGTSVTVSGLQPGETLVGIDRRPAGGTVYGVGSTSRVYTINLADGVATPVGSGPFTPAIDGTDFGLDFNPVPDAIRLVSGNEQNLRISPMTGAVTMTDPALTPAGEVTGAAYTNPVAGATATTLFYLDSASDELKTTADPNAGVLTVVGPLGQDFTAGNGYDIAARFNQGLAALDPMGMTGAPGLYNVNGFTPQAAPSNFRTALIGTLGGFPTSPLNTNTVSGMTVVNDNVLPLSQSPDPDATPSPTPTVSPTVSPTPSPSPTPKVAPKLTIKVTPKRDAKKPFRFKVRGTLTPPAKVNRVAGCAGKVKVTATRKGKKVGSGTASVGVTCRFTQKLKLNKKAGSKGKAKITARFGGNTVLKPKTASRTAKYGR